MPDQPEPTMAQRRQLLRRNRFWRRSSMVATIVLTASALTSLLAVALNPQGVRLGVMVPVLVILAMVYVITGREWARSRAEITAQIERADARVRAR